MSEDFKLATACNAYVVSMMLFCHRKKLSFAQTQAFMLFMSVYTNREGDGDDWVISPRFTCYLAKSYSVFRGDFEENLESIDLDKFLREGYRKMLDSLGVVTDSINEEVESVES